MDATTIAPPSSKIAPFPVAAVEAKLRDELTEAVKVEASIRGISLPPAPTQISKAAVHVDSLVVVSISVPLSQSSGSSCRIVLCGRVAMFRWRAPLDICCHAWRKNG